MSFSFINIYSRIGLLE